MPTLSAKGIIEAHERISSRIHTTPIISSQKINEIVGCEVFFKSEHLQKTGSFKARGAVNSVLHLIEKSKSGEEEAVAGVITHSSGNHGQALAWAAASCNLPCCVVVPKNAPASKIEAMRGYGARLELCGNTITDREAGCDHFSKLLNYKVIEPFNTIDVILGQGTIGLEIVSQVPDADAVFIAVGGGGMAAGVTTFIGEKRPDIKVFLVEPVGKRLGEVLENNGERVDSEDTLNTIADGIRVKNVGSNCLPALLKYCTKVIAVEEEEIRDALKLIWTRTKQRVEPSAAVPLAGLLKKGAASLGIKKAVVVLCGGNVDLDFVP